MNLTDEHLDSFSTEQGDSFYQKVDVRQAKGQNRCSQGKLKIELCRNFMQTHFCIYGARCNFAHGYQQLYYNNQNAHKLKTTFCKLFHHKMYCKYGSRCNFLHESQQVQQITTTTSEKRTHLLQEYPQLVICRVHKKSRLLNSLYQQS